MHVTHMGNVRSGRYAYNTCTLYDFKMQINSMQN